MKRDWRPQDLRPPWVLLEAELTEPLKPIVFGEGVNGAYVLFRFRGRPAGRIMLGRSTHPEGVSARELSQLAWKRAGSVASAMALHGALPAAAPAPETPALTIAVCTRNRTVLLRRCLDALVALRDAQAGRGPGLDLLVVDNAPPDDATRQAVAAFDGVRYALEPVPGLDFARNRALRETDRPYLGFVDDDAVVEAGWLEAFARGVRDAPHVSAFTGPVLPLTLETEAQIRFEALGGFGNGVAWELYGSARWSDPFYPASAGRLGTGANMIFSTEALRSLGGFDEALDTGPPLPGGGDVDMFYRVVRSGRFLLYSPDQAVRHDHRRDMPGLRRQLRSWGLSVGALMRKNHHGDPATRAAHRRVALWLLRRCARQAGRSVLGRCAVPMSHTLAEVAGFAQGLCGEYGRSQARVAARRREHAA